MDIIVSDADPLIALAKTGLIHILKKLFKTVYIPEAVLNELSIFDKKKHPEKSKIS